MLIGVGIVIGSQNSPWSICVTEGDLRRSVIRQGGGRSSGNLCDEPHYLVRFLERMPPGTRLPDFCSRVRAIFDKLKEIAVEATYYFVRVDVTGKGISVVQHLRLVLPEVYPTPIYFNYGDRMTSENGEIFLGKAYLVGRLQAYLQTSRLHLPKDDPQATQLAEELLSYEVELAPDASQREGAFKVGTRDELVTALGIAILEEMVPLQFSYFSF